MTGDGINIVVGDEVLRNAGHSIRLHRSIVDLVNNIAESAHRTMLEEEPVGATGGLQRHTELDKANRGLAYYGQDIEASVRVTPVTEFQAGGVSGFGRPGPKGGGERYPLDVALGTGIFGEKREPVVSPTGGVMVYRDPGAYASVSAKPYDIGTVFTHSTRGQKPNPYPERTFRRTVDETPAYIAMWGREVQSGNATRSATS